MNKNIKQHFYLKRYYIFAFLALIIAALLLQHRPAHLICSDISQVSNNIDASNNKLIPSTAVIQFHACDGTTTAISVPSLQYLNKNVSSMVATHPEMKGTWRWMDDRNLVFKADKIWHAGKHYEVTLNKKMLGFTVSLKNNTLNLNTPELSYQIKRAKFVVNLKQPKKNNVIAVITFNFPVQKNNINKYISLNNLAQQTIPTHIQWNKFHTTLFLMSDNIQLDKTPLFLYLHIGAGLSALNSPSHIKHDVNLTIKVPSKDSFLNLDSSNIYYMTMQDGRQQKMINIYSNLPLNYQNIIKNVKLWRINKNIMQHISRKGFSYIPKQLVQKIQQDQIPIQLSPFTQASDGHVTSEGKYVYPLMVHDPDHGSNYLQVNQGLEALGGFTLKSSLQKIIHIADITPKLQFDHPGVLLPLSGNRQLTYTAQGLNALKITLAQVKHASLNSLVNRGIQDGTFQRPALFSNNRYVVSQNDIAKVSSHIKYLDPKQYSALQHLTLTLPKKQPHQLGLYLITIQGWDPIKKSATGPALNHMILLTDIGMIVKSTKPTNQGGLDLFIQSIITGHPIANASINAIGKNGDVRFHGTSNRDGHLSIPPLTPDAYNPIIAITANNNHDFSFIPLVSSWQLAVNNSKYNVAGKSNNTASSLAAYIFSDRGLYRPGARVQIGMVVKPNKIDRDPSIQAHTAQLPVTLQITDPSGKLDVQQQLKLNSEGFIDAHWKSANTVPDGLYTVNLYLGNTINQDSLLGSSSFQIAQFNPATLRFKLQFNRAAGSAWHSTDHLAANLQVQNLDGLASPKQTIISTITLNYLTRFSFRQWPTYTFVNPNTYGDDYRIPQSLSVNLPTQITDQQGLAHLTIPLADHRNESFNLILQSKIYSESGDLAATAIQSTLESPRHYFIGYHLDHHFMTIKMHSHPTVNWVAIDQKQQAANITHLIINTYRLRHLPSLVQQDDGTFTYKFIVQKTLIDQQPLNLNGTTTSSLYTKQAGNYQVVVTDAYHQVRSFIAYEVFGLNHDFSNLDPTLTLHLDKDTYHPGETIHLALNLPYAGAGLLSINADHLAAYHWFLSSGKFSEQSITIPKNFHGTGYIEVDYTRSAQSKDIFSKPFAFAIANFKTTHKNSNLHITLNAPHKVLAGSQVTIHYHTNKPAKILLYGVDDGILQVAGYHPADPIAYFFSKRSDSMTTLQTLNQILPQLHADQLSASGGGSASSEAALTPLTNPFSSHLYRPVVFWSSLLNANSHTQAYHINIPYYFNGQIKVMAVAVNNQSMGSAQQTIDSQSHYIISSSLPKYITPGDRFMMPITVMNNPKMQHHSNHITVSVGVDTSFQLLDPQPHRLTLAPGSSKTIFVPIKTNNKLGMHKITVTASGGTYNSMMNFPISIRPNTVFHSYSKMGYSKDSNLTLKLPHQSYHHALMVHRLYAGNDPQLIIHGLLGDLQHAIYSTNMDPLTYYSLFSDIQTYNPLSQQGAVVQKKLQDYYDQLRIWQNTSGEFIKYYNPKDKVHTLYIMQLLTDAKQQHYSVPQDIFQRGLSLLNDMAFSIITDDDNLVNKAHAILVLSENHIIVTNAIDQINHYLDFNQDYHQSSVTLYLAAALKNLLFSTTPLQIAQRAIKQHPPSIADTVLLEKYFPSIAKKILTTKHINTLIQTLHDNSFNMSFNTIDGLKALYYYSHMQPTHATSLSFKQDIDGRPIPMINASNNTALFSPNASTLHIQSNQGGFYYLLRYSGYPSTPPTQYSRHGIDVDYQLVDKNGHPLKKVKIGQLVYYKLLLRSISPSPTQLPVSVVVMFPSGFTVDEKKMSSMSTDLRDIKFDRVIYHLIATRSVQNYTIPLRAITRGKFRIPAIYANANNKNHFTAHSRSSYLVVI